MLIQISPSAEIVPELQGLCTCTHSGYDLDGRDFVSVDALAIEVELSPQEEELLAHLVGHVTVNYCVPLVVLVDNVEGLAVPDSQVETLAVHHVVAQNAVQFAHFSL